MLGGKSSYHSLFYPNIDLFSVPFYGSTTFRWTNKNSPETFKRNSVAYFLALQVATLGAVTFGALSFYLGLALFKFKANNPLLLFLVFLLSILYLIWQIYAYKKKLS